MITPHEYQLTAARQIWSAHHHGMRSVLLVAPTGSGKTVIASFYIQQILKHLKRGAMFMAHRREIIDQTHFKLAQSGVNAGFIMADRPIAPFHDVQVASIDTLHARTKRGKIEYPDVGLLLIDEAHRAMSMRYQKVIEHYRQNTNAFILGMTATPIRTDGVGLGRSFDHMVRTPGIQWMIEHGYLVKPRYVAGIIPDLKGVRLASDGDYNPSDLQAVMDQRVLIGDIVDNWKVHGIGRTTMVFASGVQHSIHIRDRFREAGIRAEHIDADTPRDVREKIALDLTTGQVQVVTNAMIYVEGTDIPCISCVVFAQPSKSVGKYLQEGGRGLRTYENKHDCMFIDHAGVLHAHGRIELDRPWRLTQGKEMVEEIAKQKQGSKVDWHCPQCNTVYQGARCPQCGFATVVTGLTRPLIKGQLEEITYAELDAHRAKPKKVEYSMAEKQQFYEELMGYADSHGRKWGWVSHKYKEKFGVWPRFSNPTSPKQPTVATLGFIKSRNIAFARRTEKDQRHARP